jgi:hypothetical protein
MEQCLASKKINGDINMDRSRDKQKKGQKSGRRNRYPLEERHRLGISATVRANAKRGKK